MDPWLQRIPKSLTASHLMSPRADIECSLTDPAGLVVKRAKDWLEDRRVSFEMPPGRLATVILGEPGEFVDLVIVGPGGDSLLNVEEWFQYDVTAEQDEISMYAQRATLESAIDGETNFVDAMLKYEQINRSPSDLGEFKPLVVYERGRITGALEEGSFYSVPVRLAVLSFLLELEEAIVGRALSSPSEPPVWRTFLSPERIARAEDLAARRSRDRRPSDSATLNATMFIDKLTILRKSGWYQGCTSSGDLKALCSLLERIRNWCAHTADAPDRPTTAELLTVISTSREMMLAAVGRS